MSIKAETKLAAVELLLDKFGSFLEEVAVLVFVFVPLDFWRGRATILGITAVIFVAGGSFTLGLACH